MTTSTLPLRPDDGLPRFVLDLAEALASRCDVRVLAPGAPGVAERERWGGVEISRFTYFRPRRLQRLAYGGGMPHNLRRSWLARLQVVPYHWAQVRALKRALRRFGPDAVNAHWLVPQGLAAARLRRRSPGFRLLLHVHSSDVHLLRRLPLGSAVARYVLRRCDAVLASSGFVRDALDDLLGFPSRALVQPMGVHVEAFRPPEKARDAGAQGPDLPSSFVLFVGRLVEVKGAIHLIRAMARVVEQRPETALLLVGGGPDEAALRGEAERLGLAALVRFLGPRPHAEIVRLLHAAEVVAVPSIVTDRGETEGMPTVVLEAMAAGVRVVASSVGGIPDVVRHQVNGWLCRGRDPQDLARGLLDALGDAPSSGIPEAARATAREYDWERVAGRYLDHLWADRPATGRQAAATPESH